jgi:hypothetical protein
VYTDSSAVGNQGAELESGNSDCFKNMLERVGMLAVNTWEGGHPTFFQAHMGATSRPDYMCVPVEAYHAGRIQGCKVMLEEGDKMQLIPDSRRADRRLLAVQLEIKLNFADVEDRQIWNHDKIMRGFMEGWRKQELIEGVDKDITDREEEFERVAKHSVSKLHELLLEVVMRHAGQIYRGPMKKLVAHTEAKDRK